MKGINSSSSKADEGNGHACARTTRAADTALGGTFLCKKRDREKGKEEIESSKVSDPVVVWLMSKNAFDIFSRFLLSGADCLGGLDLHFI